MHQSALLYLLAAAGVANAAGQPLVPNSVSMPGAGLFARQFDVCTSKSTCAQCYGDGYVICDTIGCFNPEIHQQCCSFASLCVGKTNNCCKDWGGPGVTGTSGVPNVTAVARPTESLVSYTCSRSDTGEECCQRAHIPLHWCAGDFPNFGCYNDKNQFCCTDGTVCDEEDCCDLFDASTTHPWAATATNPPTASSAPTTTATTGSVTDGPTAAAASTSTTASTSTSTAGASLHVSGPGLMAIGLAAFGML